MRVIVVSVGTSLLNNNEKDPTRMPAVPDLMNKFNEEMIDPDAIDIRRTESGWDIQPDNVEYFLDVARDFENEYFYEDKIKKNIRGREKGKDRLPAEISSLFLFYYDRNGNLRSDFQGDLKERSDTEFREKDRIVLLTTHTADAVYCANIIREMIKCVPLFSQKCVPDEEIAIIRNLDVFRPDRWAGGEPMENGEVRSGLKNLYNEINNLSTSIEEEGGNPEKIIIRTGGYKELCANLLMLALDKRFRSYYLFEKSYKFIAVNSTGWPRKYSQIARETYVRP